MTGRNSGGVRARFGLTGFMAAATILAASLLGLAWAQGGKSEEKRQNKRPGQQQGAQPTQAPQAPDTARGNRPVTRTIGSATVAVDPATGRLVPPSPEEVAKLTASLHKMLSRETEDLLVIEREDGSLVASLDEAFQEVAMATRDRKGSLRLHCVGTPAQADRLLSGAADNGPVYNERAASRKAARKGGKNTPAPAEKE